MPFEKRGKHGVKDPGSIFKGLVSILVLGFIAVRYFGDFHIAADVKPTLQKPPAQPAPPMPEPEQRLAELIAQFANDYRTAPNDMAKGALRVRRAAAICKLGRSSGGVKDWVGQVETMSSNNTGHGVLAVRISPTLSVSTYNNDFSDEQSNTLIKVGTALHQQALTLVIGQWIKFSGAFFSHPDDCLQELSLTVEGAMTDPTFLFRFTSLTPAR